MCRKMSDEENQLAAQVARDNEHFKGLLDLIPPHAYFSQEEKDEIWGNTAGSDEDDEAVNKKKKKAKNQSKGANPMGYMTISQITEMRQRGETVGKKRKKHTSESEGEEKSGIAAKQEGKKQSRSTKSNKKTKPKEMQKKQARLEELREKLHKKLADIKAQKMAGQGVNTQEQKRLRRQEKKVNARLKHSGKNNTNQHKEQRHAAAQIAQGLRSPAQNRILNDNGVPVRSKFDFSTFSLGNEKTKSELHGRDYKRLLEKVERRNEKVQKLKEKDKEAGQRLESKLQWQSVLSRAQGEKVKDDMNLLKKAAKRKDKLKDRKKKKWGDRVKTVEDKQKKRQDKRQANIDKRKTDKKDKKRKKLIKKGRIIPGF